MTMNIRWFSGLIFFIFLIVCLSYLYPWTAPLNSKPSTIKEAKALARTIAKFSHCKSLEFDHFIENKVLISSCYKTDLTGGEYSNGSFSIYVFFTKTEKELQSMKLDASSHAFKEGEYFIVNENSIYGESKQSQPRVKSANAYSDFPGKLHVP